VAGRIRQPGEQQSDDADRHRTAQNRRATTPYGRGRPGFEQQQAGLAGK